MDGSRVDPNSEAHALQGMVALVRGLCSLQHLQCFETDAHYSGGFTDRVRALPPLVSCLATVAHHSVGGTSRANLVCSHPVAESVEFAEKLVELTQCSGCARSTCKLKPLN